MNELLLELYDNELAYTEFMYGEIELKEDVATYVRYNANRALMNLGKEPYFPIEEINPIVENGKRTNMKNFDFFSTKGNGYILPTRIEYLTDEDFVFDDVA